MTEPAIPRYTTWGKVPADCYTRTQLGKMDPPRRLLPGAPVAGRVLYHGNKYADLYRLTDSEPKSVPDPVRVAAARHAGELRYVCRWCEERSEDRLHRRICGACEHAMRAYAGHLSARARLGGLHQPIPWRPLYAATSGEPDGFGYATRIVVVGEYGMVIADLGMPPVRRNPDGSPWNMHAREDVDAWYAKLRDVCARRTVIAWRQPPGGICAGWEYRRWLGAGHDTSGMPGATGDPRADARTLSVLVREIVTGKMRPPAPMWEARGITPEQMRPYLGGYVTAEVRAQLKRIEDKS